MNKLLFMLMNGMARPFLMEEAGGDGGGGTAGQAAPAADAGGQAQAGDAGALAGASGGQAQAGQDGDKGALAGGGAGFDFEKGTVDDYMKAVKSPEGREYNADSLKEFFPLMKEYGIQPEAFTKFLAVDAKMADAEEKKAAEAEQKRVEAEKAAFKAEGDALRKEFNPEQIGNAVKALESFRGDKAFFELATGRMSNNATLVRLLVNWQETHKSDNVAGAASGAGTSADDFAALWKGSSRS